jgi:hypothetical protein
MNAMKIPLISAIIYIERRGEARWIGSKKKEKC